MISVKDQIRHRVWDDVIHQVETQTRKKIFLSVFKHTWSHIANQVDDRVLVLIRRTTHEDIL